MAVEKKEFIFHSKKVHLTYKSHIPFEELKFAIREKFGGFQWHSIVHELGDEKEANATPYEHTHAAFIWDVAPYARGERCFDFKKIHPNIQTNKGQPWIQNIFENYHHGKKVKADGKPYYIKPVAIDQNGPPSWIANLWDAVAACTQLKDAAELCEIRPKTLADCEKIMKAGRKRRFTEVEFDCTKSFIDPPENWDPAKETMILWGDTKAGKSNWVRNYFKGGCFEVSEVENIKYIPADATGILFDDQDYAKLKIQTQKSITDCRIGRSIKMRNINGWKPHIPAIMTCNDIDAVIDLSEPAIKTRTFVWDVRGKIMYN